MFESVIRHCDALLDLHTGSFHRTNMPQIRADLTQPGLERLARGFGVGVVVHSVGRPGTLRRAASDAGVAAITYEAGEPMRFQRKEIERGVRGVTNLLVDLGLIRKLRRRGKDPLVFEHSRWVRVRRRRHLHHRPRARRPRARGRGPRRGDRSGVERTQRDPRAVLGPHHRDGALPGRDPGFAAFHLGVDSTPQEAPVAVEEVPAETAAVEPPAPAPPDQVDPEEVE